MQPVGVEAARRETITLHRLEVGDTVRTPHLSQPVGRELADPGLAAREHSAEARALLLGKDHDLVGIADRHLVVDENASHLQRSGDSDDAVEAPALEHAIDVRTGQDRKSTRLNSSHVSISYAVFCLKK